MVKAKVLTIFFAFGNAIIVDNKIKMIYMGDVFEFLRFILY